MTPARTSQTAVVGDSERVVLLSLAATDPQPLVLSGSAPLIWASIDGTRTVEEIAEHVGDRVGLPASTVVDDVRACIHSLVRHGFLAEG